jgi:hypothetical protein
MMHRLQGCDAWELQSSGLTDAHDRGQPDRYLGCNGAPAQNWSAPAPGKTGEMRVLGGCAAVNGSKTRGTKVVWDRCTGSAQQKWSRRTSGSILP